MCKLFSYCSCWTRPSERSVDVAVQSNCETCSFKTIHQKKCQPFVAPAESLLLTVRSHERLSLRRRTDGRMRGQRVAEEEQEQQQQQNERGMKETGRRTGEDTCSASLSLFRCLRASRCQFSWRGADEKKKLCSNIHPTSLLSPSTRAEAKCCYVHSYEVHNRSHYAGNLTARARLAGGWMDGRKEKPSGS